MAHIVKRAHRILRAKIPIVTCASFENSRNPMAAMERHRSAAMLSPRETEMFVLRAQGHATGKIAQLTGAKEKTVTHHQEIVRRKLRLTNHLEYTAFAIQWGRFYLPSLWIDRCCPRVPPTRSESVVGCLYAAGKGRAAIARQLDISVRTVDVHLASLRTKLRLRSRDEFIQAGFLEYGSNIVSASGSRPAPATSKRGHRAPAPDSTPLQ